MIINDAQDRQIENWLANDNVARIDTLPHDEIPGVVKCHIFGRGAGDDLELIAIGIINADATEWWLTGASEHERQTIFPIADEEGAQS